MIPRWLQWDVLCQRLFLVYPSAADKQTIRPLRAGDSSGALSWSLSIQSHCGQPPPPGHWWNAAPGILPQLTGCRAAAGWNMIRPLSKHAFHYGCVQGRTDSGNTSNCEQCSLWPAALSWMLISTAFLGSDDSSRAIYVRLRRARSVITADNDSMIFVVMSWPRLSCQDSVQEQFVLRITSHWVNKLFTGGFALADEMQKVASANDQ